MNESSEITPAAEARDIIARATVAQRKDTKKAMVKETLARTINMAGRALKRAEDTIAKVLKLVPPPSPIACQAGCPWCCHIRLTASAPEVLVVLKYIRDTFSNGEIAALKRKIANIDGFTRRLDGEARAKLRLPCPLLKDGSCSVHEVRPLSCRGVVSVDVGACKRAYDSHMQEPVPQHELQIQAANAIGYGIYAGLADAGFDLEDLEFTAALALGLEDKDIGKRWVNGEGVFTAAAEMKKF